MFLSQGSLAGMGQKVDGQNKIQSGILKRTNFLVLNIQACLRHKYARCFPNYQLLISKFHSQCQVKFIIDVNEKQSREQNDNYLSF